MNRTQVIAQMLHEAPPRPPRPQRVSLLAEALRLVTLTSLCAALTGCKKPLCPEGASAYGEVGVEVVCYQGERLKHGKHTKWFPLTSSKTAPAKASAEPPTPLRAFERMYLNNMLNGVSREWYSNGQLKTEASYLDGKLDGPYLRWYANGEPQINGRYKNNLRIGPFLEYYKNGKPKAAYNYSEYGSLEGPQLHYRSNGFKMRQETYVSGRMVGRKYWRHDGTPDPVISLQ